MHSQLLQNSNVPSIRTSLRSLIPAYQLKELIIQKLINVWEHYPQAIDETIFRHAELLFVLTTDEFKQQRTQQHLIRMIFSLYFIQKSLRRLVIHLGEKRHLHFRLVQTCLKFPFGTKPVLAFMGGICLFDKQENFEEKHLLLAAQKLIPEIQILKGTTLLHHDPQDSIRLIYTEFEKKSGGTFTISEIALLKRGLQTELHSRVEKNIPSLFMIRNEEEVMKNILILSREIDLSDEIPEMMINFEQQMHSAISFTIILVRVLKNESKKIEELFCTLPHGVRFILDRSQIIGYPKEATVFHLEIPLEASFFRADCSINFYLARQKVKSILLDTIGPVRDFNGGMILKQGELLSQLKEAFQEIEEKDPLLIENFFYSLNPIEKQTTIPLEVLRSLFSLFLENLKESSSEDSYTLNVRDDTKNVYAVFKSEDESISKILDDGLFHFKDSITMFKLSLKNFYFMGFTHNKEKVLDQEFGFLNFLGKRLKKWHQERENRQIASLAIRHVPTSFDPRVGGDSNSRALLKMLFEGLMRIGKDGKPTPAIAKSVTISSDKKTYIFHLRSSSWSDGSPLIAFDFEYAWKKIVSPDFTTPFASFFYPIQNARAVSEKKISLHELGVKAIDELTLKVTLEYPAPYFLELVALPLFSPISHKVDWVHPNWTFQDGDAYVCNGPFCLKRKNINYGYELTKNPLYWNDQEVILEQILIRKITDSSAYELFGKNSIDWIGHALPFWDPLSAKQFSSQISSHPSPKVLWNVFNSRCIPFHNQKIRKALSYCIDKERLISLLNYEVAIPATSPLPLSHSQQSSFVNWNFDPDYAQKMLAEGLIEIGIEKRNFLPVTFLSPYSNLHERTAKLIKQQWEEILGISCRIAFMEWEEMFPKICRGDYEVCLLTWTAWVNDPMYTLNAFKYSKDEVNFSKWENVNFQKLLDQASQEEEPSQFLKKAENLLIDEMPVNPLFSMKNQCISQNYFCFPCDPLFGDPDFKSAYIKKTKAEK
jgi:oligopeptide transport system substrate-binding protein